MAVGSEPELIWIGAILGLLALMLLVKKYIAERPPAPAV